MHLPSYAYASFATNGDFTSQLGFLVLLSNKFNKSQILDYSSCKSKRVVHSIMGGYIYAFADGFDRAFIIRHDLKIIFRRKIPIMMLTGSNQMFNVITKASTCSERLLMIYISATRQVYNEEEISNVGLVLSDHNVADDLINVKHCPALEYFIRTRTDKNPVQQWITRTTSCSSF